MFIFTGKKETTRGDGKIIEKEQKYVSLDLHDTKDIEIWEKINDWIYAMNMDVWCEYNQWCEDSFCDDTVMYFIEDFQHIIGEPKEEEQNNA